MGKDNSSSHELTAIVKPTESCNFACKYCYVDQEADKEKMTIETAEKMTEFLLNGRDRITIIWHGGEPLLMGVDFYKRIYDFQREKLTEGKMIKNLIQTNGSLLNDEFVDFFKYADFKVGTSIDGPKEIHDMQRVYKDGRGTYDDVCRGIDLAMSKLGNIGTISVITKNNIYRMQEVYDFIKEKKIKDMKLNPFFADGRGKENEDELSINPRVFGEECIKIFDEWYGSNEPFVEIKNLQDYINRLVSPHLGPCIFQHNCREKFLSVNHKGDVYPCGRFSYEQEFKLGNVYTSSLDDVQSSPVNDQFEDRPEKTRKCSKCDVSSYCNGGCPSSAYTYTGKILAPDYFCKSFNMLFKHVEKKIYDDAQKSGLIK